MQSDSLFYQLFQTSPQVFFELIGTQLPQQGLYSLISQEVKQTRFQIDGVLLPHHRRADLPIYFLEVMGYKPKQGKHFYQELLTEIHLYLNDYQPQNDWRAVVIYTQRSFDPGLPIQLSEYTTGDRLQRLYLDRLPTEWEGRSLEVRAIQLMGAKKNIVAAQAKSLIEQARTESNDDTTLKAVLQLINTIIIYKFPDRTRQEIEAMLGLSELKETRVYKDAYQDGELEGELKIALKIALLQLTRKFGEMAPSLQDKIKQLSTSQLEDLATSLLDFNSTDDLENWLNHQN
jgi:predicted transposase/invertase (TIGR01784 family)